MDQEDVEPLVVEWLAAHGEGWSVLADGGPLPHSISLRHEASHGLVFDWTELGDGDVSDWIVRALSNSAEISIASAAPTLTHPDFILGLRTLALAFSWTSLQARAVSFLLYEFDHLTEAEAEWFAGWIGEDAPMRGVSPRSG